MSMPFELYDGATCPYCGKSELKVSDGKCAACGAEFAEVYTDDGEGNTNNFLGDNGRVREFIDGFMNPPIDSELDVVNF